MKRLIPSLWPLLRYTSSSARGVRKIGLIVAATAGAASSISVAVTGRLGTSFVTICGETVLAEREISEIRPVHRYWLFFDNVIGQ